MALATAFVLCACAMPWFIRFVKCRQNGGQPIREDGPKSHIKSKAGTPTMGGVVIVLSSILSSIMWTDLANLYCLVVIVSFLLFGLIGALDDVRKIMYRNSRGVSANMKLFLQSLITVSVCYLLSKEQGADFTKLYIPYTKGLYVNLDIFYYLFAVLVVVGCSNAVNLTDGLDGLVSVPSMVIFMVFALISYLVGNYIYSSYLKLHYIVGSGELAIFCCAIVGSLMAFLWYNCQPAAIFMGDSGSLALGGALGVIALITKHEIILAIAGGLFVIEAVSVILQVTSFKIRSGKRIFKMAPLHHHFEHLGWSETKVVVRFWIICILFALVALASLKIR